MDINNQLIDMNRQHERPPDCLRVKIGMFYRRMFTLGNFSAIKGKQKSKKSTLVGMMAANAIAKSPIASNKFESALENAKRHVYYFDTEQGDYDVWKMGKLMKALGSDMDRLHLYSLREFAPEYRRELIFNLLRDEGDRAGLVVIDGIADLVRSINDESESTDVVTDLLDVTKSQQIHITNVIHERKGDGYARGHIGTGVMNKSECVISVIKDEKNHAISDVICSDIRGARPFDDFTIGYDMDGSVFWDEKDKIEFDDHQRDF